MHQRETDPMLNEFKAFIARGNVMDLAVGVIIGGAFGGIVKSLVDDLIMPIVAQSLAAAREQGAVFAYGSFLTVLINFLILAWIIFLMVKGVNTLRAQVERQEKAAPEELPAPPADVQLLTEIRDLLATRPTA
jgi:large conductance mechanosensitive channel